MQVGPVSGDDSHRAGHAGVADAAVAGGVLGEVLLVTTLVVGSRITQVGPDSYRDDGDDVLEACEVVWVPRV